MPEFLHIVCLDAPAPPDYGGAIDMFYKIKALAQTGRKIILHYFDYKDRNIDSIRPFCHAVFSYKRTSIFSSLIKGRPHTIASRLSPQLIERLNRDDHPIVFEGFHCSGVIPYIHNSSRKMLVRVHNDEATYYARLAYTEMNLLAKWYLARESRLLFHYQQSLNKSVRLACLSQKDAEIFTSRYGFKQVCFLPTFLPWQSLNNALGRGSYCLYHGNLQVSENEAAAAWLLERVFPQLDIPIIIAGKNPSKRLRSLVLKTPGARLVANPSLHKLDELVEKAHIHVLPSLNETGVKLKLLHALFRGRFCISNAPGVEGSEIAGGLVIADSAHEYIAHIQALRAREFTQEDQQQRQALLAIYDNAQSAQSLNAWL